MHVVYASKRILKANGCKKINIIINEKDYRKNIYIISSLVKLTSTYRNPMKIMVLTN